ncbi:MAG: hypothetical protein K9N51_02550 [Candidatus Pacebacteria bacterium]|nr:hypothetical protein [Candidatus Paceibacterota bacterium]
MATVSASSTDNRYRRIRGHKLKKPRLLTISQPRSSIWLASDHLLHVEWHYLSESYRRFYFRDIQAILIQRTKLGLVLTICYCLLIPLFCLGLFILGYAPKVFFGSLAATMIVLLIVNLLRGPTCVCVIQTAVQAAKLSAVRRVRTAEGLRLLLFPRIEEAQGELTVPGVSDQAPATSEPRPSGKQLQNSRARPFATTGDPDADTDSAVAGWNRLPHLGDPDGVADSQVAGGNRLPRLDESGAGVEPPPLPRSRQGCGYRGAFHVALFGLLTGVGLLWIVSLLTDAAWIALCAIACAGCAFCMAIMALIRQASSAVPHFARRFTWGGLVYIVLCGVFTYVFYMVMVLEHPGATRNPLSLLAIIARQEIQGSSLLLPAVLALGVVSLFLGMGGLLSFLTVRHTGATVSDNRRTTHE